MIETQNKALLIFLIMVTKNYSTFAREEWVDPHDMNIKIETVINEENNRNDKLHSTRNSDIFYRDKSSVHLRKVVQLINDMIYFDRRTEVYKGIIDIHMNENDYDFLRKYLSADLNGDHNLEKLTEILEKSFEKSIYSSYFFSIGEILYLMLFNENLLLSLALIIILFILWKIQPHNYNFGTLLKIFIPLVYFADFVLRYRAKLEEVEIDKFLLYEDFESCDPEKLSLFNWIYNKFTGYCQKNRREYFLSQRAATHIFTPLNVISEQFGIFVTIFKYLGAGFGSFMWAFIEDAPWYVKPLLGLLSFLLVIIILIMLGSYIFDLSPKINLFHMIQFEFLHKSSNNGNQISRDSVSSKDFLRLRDQNNATLIFPASSNLRKISLPTFKTKSKFFKRNKIMANNEKIVSIQKTN